MANETVQLAGYATGAVVARRRVAAANGAGSGGAGLDFAIVSPVL
jgi:hypothetical protein